MAKLFGCDSLAPAFHEDWEQMCTLLQEQGVETSRGAVIPVVLNCFLVGHEHDKSRLFTSCLRQLLSCIEEPHIVYPHLPRFKIEFIQVNAEGLVVTPSGVALVQELLALRVRVGYLGMYSCFPQEQRDAWASLLFAVLGHPRATVRTTFPIEEVRLGQLDQSACTSLSSVLVQATNIRHFTPASSASITSAKLDLSGNTNGDDLKVLGVANPYTQLLDAIEPLEDIDLGSVHLPEGAEIRFSDDSTDVLVVKNIEGETCPVLRHDPLSTVLDILVPGYGHGMVERSSVIEKRRRSIQIQFINDQLSQLLAHVGQCVDSLELAGKLYGSTHGYMADILGKCPNLQHLDIAMMAGTILEDITNAYILGRGPRTLTFGSWDEEYLEDSVVKIYEKLGDPTSSMARRLEKLAMNEKRSDNRMIGAKSCEAPANALHNNMRLSYFEAYMAPSYLRECTRIMNRLYDQTHGTTCGNQAERLWMVTRPLAMQVFASHASNGTYWACHRIRPSQQRFIRRCERQLS